MQGPLRPKLKIGRIHILQILSAKQVTSLAKFKGQENRHHSSWEDLQNSIAKGHGFREGNHPSLSKKHLAHLGLKERTTIPVSFLAPHSAFCSPFLLNYSPKSLSPYIRALTNSDEMIWSRSYLCWFFNVKYLVEIKQITLGKFRLPESFVFFLNLQYSFHRVQSLNHSNILNSFKLTFKFFVSLLDITQQ